MNELILKNSIQELFEEHKETRKIELKYSAKFKGFNANVRYNFQKITFSLSKDWLEISDDIKIGLIQHLASKIIKKPYKKTFQLDLYEKFISNLPRYAKITNNDPILENSFNKMNKKYFDNLLERPNLVWGEKAFKKLGHYEYQTDTILISSIFKKNIELLNFVMFHEMLHKKHGMKKTKTGRMIHHSKAFREDEKKYEDKQIERKLSWFASKQKIKNFLGF